MATSRIYHLWISIEFERHLACLTEVLLLDEHRPSPGFAFLHGVCVVAESSLAHFSNRMQSDVFRQHEKRLIDQLFAVLQIVFGNGRYRGVIFRDFSIHAPAVSFDRFFGPCLVSRVAR